MKLVSLNIWGGQIFEPFLEFIKEHAPDTDIFCLQEVFQSSSGVETSHGARMNIMEDIQRLLPDFDVFTGWAQDNFDNEGPVDFEVTTGLATFVKKPLKVLSSENIFIYGEKNGTNLQDPTTMPANMLCTKIQAGEKEHMICNIHAYAYPGDKLDTPGRIEQSQKIIHFLTKDLPAQAGKGAKILCGDFNLMPATQSITMLEKKVELKNLIKEFKITNTRNEISWSKYPNKQNFADFTFVSSGIKVNSFQVPYNVVSDHLPMILCFE